MSQAKVLNERDVRRVLLFIANNRHAVRNRAMFLTLQYTGMRCGELSALQLSSNFISVPRPAPAWPASPSGALLRHPHQRAYPRGDPQ